MCGWNGEGGDNVGRVIWEYGMGKVEEVDGTDIVRILCPAKWY